MYVLLCEIKEWKMKLGMNRGSVIWLAQFIKGIASLNYAIDAVLTSNLIN